MHPTLGAIPIEPGRVAFRVWAPRADAVDLRITSPNERTVPMRPAPQGHFEATIGDIEPGMRYVYRINGQELPDPASRFQPEGVHGPSEVVDPFFEWSDAGWIGARLEDLVFYELHVGTFTAGGTFDDAIEHLNELCDLGVTAIQFMPVAAFPGRRNWGYDGVAPFAVQASYGGPTGLKRFVDAAHRAGLAVALDVVYNHLGPEGNYLAEFGPYFTDKHRTPWGPAVNFDGAGADEVRRFFIESAVRWIDEFHIDALRLDAVHAILDQSAYPFLQELGEAVHNAADRLGRRAHVIPESDLNDPRLVRSVEHGGFGLDAQWSDDFHHALHALLTGEHGGYYRDFGGVEHLASAYNGGYTYTGQRSVFRNRRHGASGDDLPSRRFVVFAQNHDQIGNRPGGDRLATLVGFERQKLALGAVLASPFIPLLFMGEEYGEPAPFLYFVEHGDEDLIEAVRRGRREEFTAFQWRAEPPDPQSPETFERSRPDRALAQRDPHRTLRTFCGELLRLRTAHPALDCPGPADRETDHRAVAFPRAGSIMLHRRYAEAEALILMNFSDSPWRSGDALPSGAWRRLLDSTDSRWDGPGASTPASFNGQVIESVVVAPSSISIFESQRGS